MHVNDFIAVQIVSGKQGDGAGLTQLSPNRSMRLNSADWRPLQAQRRLDGLPKATAYKKL